VEAPKQEHQVVFLQNFFDELRRRVPLGKQRQLDGSRRREPRLIVDWRMTSRYCPAAARPLCRSRPA
jgi:hypothetical protein